MATANTIVLNSNKGESQYKEYIANSAISPGMRVKLRSDGKVEPESVQGALGPKLIAVEDALQGRTTADAYAAGDVVRCYDCLPGDHVQVLCLTGADIDINDKLIVNAAGKYIETTGTPAQTDFVALEDSGGALAADTLLKVMCL